MAERHTPKDKRRLMHQHHTKILGISRLKHLHQKLHHMEIHILQPKPSQVKDKTSLLIRMPDHRPDRLDIMQHEPLHALLALQLGIVQPDLDDEHGPPLAVRPAHVRLAGAVLRHEALVVGGHGGGVAEGDAVAHAHDAVVQPVLVAPV
jgi:hypothetical protein